MTTTKQIPIEVRTSVVLVSSTPTAVLHGVLGAVRSLGRLGIPVHLVHPLAHTPMSRSRFMTSSRTLRLRQEEPQVYLRELQAFGAELGDRPVLIACDDAVALLIADHQESLAEHFRLRIPTAQLSHALSDKALLAQICATYSIDTPRSAVPTTPAEVEAFAEQVGLPLVVKIADPNVLLASRGTDQPGQPGRPRQQPSVQIVNTMAELHEAMLDGDRVRPGRILQQHIRGGADSIWMFNGYVDAQGRCVHGYTARKLRQCRPGTGYTSLGICEVNPEVEHIAKKLLHDVAYQGIVDLGLLRDERTGRYLLLDVNPRLGATFRLFVGADGTDVVRALYADLTDQPLPPSGTVAGRRWVTEPHDTYAALLYRRTGDLTVRRWVWSYRKVDERAWWAADDPVPFVAMLGWVAQQGLAAGRRRIGARTSAWSAVAQASAA